MRNLKTSFRICLNQLANMFLSPKTYAAFMFGAAFMLNVSKNYLEYTLSIGEKANIFDPFILASGGMETFIYIFLGFLLLISDAPFMDQRTSYAVLRTGKVTWATGMIIYIAFAAAIYYLFMFVLSALLVSGNAIVTRLWSDPMYTLAVEQPVGALIEYGISYSFGVPFMTRYNSVEAVLISISLQILYSVVIGMSAFTININAKKIVGTLSAIVIHFIGYSIYKATSGFGGNQWLSPFANAVAVYHNYDGSPHSAPFPTLSYSYTMFILLMIALSVLAVYMVKRCDFKTASGGKR